jgi:hypothetical protein
MTADLMRRARTLLRLLVAATTAGVLGGFVASCTNPVPDGEIVALGAEAPNVSPGPTHRAGQPCVLCHSSSGPASSFPFTVAGTIFQSPAMAVGVDSAEILLVDSVGSSPNAPVFTNAVGNFYISADEWNPAFPIFAGVFKDGVRRSMQSHISREPSCAFCHKDPVSAGEALSAVGHVYLNR